MNIVLFVGPSLPAAAVAEQLSARILPPAAMGDILREARRGASAIGLIDGAFDGVLPVWHKEILWAMSQGVHVFGAASMGALRAAELDGFGMRGIGRVYGGYRSGEFEADDEVAVLHGPAEVGYAAVTEALVNIRATVECAVLERSLDDAQAAALLERARAMHYRERTWDALLAGMAADVAGRLRAWLPKGRVDRKRQDAALLVAELAAFARSDPPPMQVDYRFAWTDAWDALYRRVPDGGPTDDILDELRLQPARFRVVRRAALARVLAKREVEATGGATPTTGAAGAVERLRTRLGLWRRADLDRWLALSDLDEHGLRALATEEMRLEGLEEDAGTALGPAMLAELRLSGELAGLAERARQKSVLLAAATSDLPGVDPSEIDVAPLLARLAEALDGRDADLVRQLGFASRAALNRTALREARFQRILATSKGADSVEISAQPDSS